MRFIAESLGEKVTWDGKTKSVYIGDVPKFIALKDVKPIEVMKTTSSTIQALSLLVQVKNLSDPISLVVIMGRRSSRPYSGILSQWKL